MTLDQGFADIEPITLHKRNNSRKSRKGPFKADLCVFDRAKFYQRLGVKLSEEDEQHDGDNNSGGDCLMVAEICTTEFGSVGLADD